MKNNNLNKLEQRLNEKLNEASFGFEEKYWLDIEARLNPPTFYAKYSTTIKIAAVIIIASGSLLYLQTRTSEKIPIKVSDIEIESKIPEQQDSKPIVSEKQEIETTDDIVEIKKLETNNSANKESINPQEPEITNLESSSLSEPIKLIKKANIEEVIETKTDYSTLIELNVSGNICPNSTITLTAITDRIIESEEFIWSVNGKETISNESYLELKLNESGLYHISVKNETNNISTEIEILESPEINFTYEDIANPYWDEAVVLNAMPSELDYTWDIQGLENPIIGNNQTIDLSSAGLYDVELNTIDKNGCAVQISKPILVQKDFDPLAPNVFSPDGDGLNDVFIPKGFTNIEGHFKLSIFQVNGTLIFETTSIFEPWNGLINNVGHKLENGSFIWKVEITNNERTKHFSGHFKNYVPTMGY